MKRGMNGGVGASVLACLLASACAVAGPLTMTNSPVNPAAQGQVRIRKGNNDNTRLDIQVKHLTPPEKIDPKAGAYVVWAKPNGQGRAENLGALEVDKDLEGKLETVTAFKNFQLLITPEPTPQVVDPSGQPLLWTNVNR